MSAITLKEITHPQIWLNAIQPWLLKRKYWLDKHTWTQKEIDNEGSKYKEYTLTLDILTKETVRLPLCVLTLDTQVDIDKNVTLTYHAGIEGDIHCLSLYNQPLPSAVEFLIIVDSLMLLAIHLATSAKDTQELITSLECFFSRLYRKFPLTTTDPLKKEVREKIKRNERLSSQNTR